MDRHRRARAQRPDSRGPDSGPERENAPDTVPEAPTLAMMDGQPAGGRTTARTVDVTLDVRGQRVDDAVAQVDRFVDEGLLAGRDALFIVHGHGTGALRSAIRTHLGGHKAIDTFRPGEQNEGGDGVTVAFLKG